MTGTHQLASGDHLHNNMSQVLYITYACSTRGEDWALSSSQQGLYGSGAARQRAQAEADENLASHFISVQSISDSTTLPQMLEELERHLNRAASLDALILQLRCGNASISNLHGLHACIALICLASAGWIRTKASLEAPNHNDSLNGHQL